MRYTNVLYEGRSSIFSSYNSSLRSSHKWFSYIHNFIIILSRVYNKPIQRPAPSWLVSLIGRALHWYRQRSRVWIPYKPNFFFREWIVNVMYGNCLCVRNKKKIRGFFSQLQKLRVFYNCDDLPWYNSPLRSSHIWFLYIHNFIQMFIIIITIIIIIIVIFYYVCIGGLLHILSICWVQDKVLTMVTPQSFTFSPVLRRLLMLIICSCCPSAA